MPAPRVPPFPPEILAEIEAAIGRGVSSDAEVQRVADVAVARYNNAPQADMGGLTPLQMAALLATDWVSPGVAVRLNQRLTPGDLSASPLFHNARALLTMLRDEGPLGATAKGNLNRKAVAELIPHLQLDAERLAAIREMCKVINEPDIGRLVELRMTLQELGLIYRRKGFRITPKGRELLTDPQAGRLFAMAFMGTVVSPPFEWPMFQLHGAERVALPFAVRELARRAGAWSPEPELSTSVWPPFVYDQLRETRGFWTFEAACSFLTFTSLIQPLHDAGLLEVRFGPRNGGLTSPEAVRTTQLFQKAFTFAF